MLPELSAWFGLVFLAAAAAALFVPRLLRPHRVTQQAGTAPVSPARSSHAGGTGVPVGVAFEREPYDRGCVVVEISDEERVT